MTPRDLIDAFETIAEAPEGIPRLRELVLELAVRGNLVSQDREDEPASVLLDRIAAKKERLVSEKKIRKPKVLPPVSDDEVPFEVPEGWVWCRIEQLCQQVTDGVHQTPKYIPRGVPFLSIKDISGGSLDFTNTRFVSEKAHREMNTRCDPKRGDILFCRIGTLGRALVVDTDRAFSLFVSVGLIKLTGHLDPEFLRTALNSPSAYDQYDRIKAGGSHTNKLNLGTMRGAVMPLAPLAEQRRIVAKVNGLMALLDRLEAARDSREATRVALRDAALAALREADSADEVEVAMQRIAERMDDLFTDPADPEPLRQTVLQLAVRGRLVPQDSANEPALALLERIREEKATLVRAKVIAKLKPVMAITDRESPFHLPEGWAWARMTSICTHIIDCLHSTPKYSEVGLPAIRTADVVPGRLLLSQARRVAPEVYEDRIRRLEPAPGDILYTREGERLGIAATIPNGVVCCLAQRMAHLRTSSLVLSDYIAWYLNSPSGYGAARGAVNQTTSPHVNMSTIRALVVPMPPIAEQRRIIAKLDELMGLIDRLDERLIAVNALQDAFASAAVHSLEA